VRSEVFGCLTRFPYVFSSCVWLRSQHAPPCKVSLRYQILWLRPNRLHGGMGRIYPPALRSGLRERQLPSKIGCTTPARRLAMDPWRSEPSTARRLLTMVPEFRMVLMKHRSTMHAPDVEPMLKCGLRAGEVLHSPPDAGTRYYCTLYSVLRI